MLTKLFALVAGTLLYAALGYGLYLLSGKQSMPFLWAVLISQTTICVIGSLMLPAELIAERMKPKGKDRDPLATLFLSIFCLAQLVIAVLDQSRWHLTDKVPFVLQCTALVIQSLGWAGLYWAMYVNKFFSSAIRMQQDRGQTVITEGPYRWIRHPGYAFASLAFVFESIAIGSWLSIIPAFMMVGYMGYRTLLEEKMLAEELEGYTEYAAKVRYRWIPGIW
ncbi:MAG: isoprenylcysteine carboxylmethyltransferase family protein [Cyanobacteria bacterium SZAS-4]|nr:isoprenylcysteine carboxylmethyltransferase family protein [Cyanobacteria bacterium SZAS-4]